ncbi:MAG: extracellular solute-binding protein [Pseudomonadota bacterium]
MRLIEGYRSVRRLFLGALILNIAFLSIAARASELNVYNWSNYIDPSAIGRFESNTGIKVNYDIFESNEMLEAKLLTGNSDYDVVVPTGEFLHRQISAGLYQEIDLTKVPNSRYLDPILMDAAKIFDPSNLHAVIYAWGTTGLGIDVNAAAERGVSLDGAGWELLLDPSLAEVFADCGIAVLDDPLAMVAITLAYQSNDPNSTDASDIENAFEALSNIRSLVKNTTSSQFASGLAAGDYCLTVGYSGDLLALRTHQAVSREVSFILPHQGAPLWMDMLAIPVQAGNIDGAHSWINEMISIETSIGFTNSVRYPTANIEANKLVMPEVRMELDEIFTEVAMRSLWTPKPKPAEYHRLVNRLWIRWKSGQ